MRPFFDGQILVKEVQLKMWVGMATGHLPLPQQAHAVLTGSFIS